MAILGSIIQPPAYLEAIEIAQVSHCSRVGFQTIGDDRFGFAVALQGFLQKAQSRGSIPFAGDVASMKVIRGRPTYWLHLAVKHLNRNWRSRYVAYNII